MNKYEFTLCGKVFNLKTKRELKQKQYKNNGTCLVSIYENGERKNLSVHVAIAQKYLPNPNNYYYVGRKNGDSNSVNNLFWCRLHPNITYNLKKK